jgi:polar amino acid transport system permease protein
MAALFVPAEPLALSGLLPSLLGGAAVTLKLTGAAALVALACAFTAGLARTSRRGPVRWITTVYVEIFRGTSLLVQLVFFFFVLPLWGVRLSAFTAAALAVGLNFGAYGSEIVRAAVRNVAVGQYEAAAALNFSRGMTLRRIILPQAIPMMLPPFGNQLIELMKATALASFITVGELTYHGKLLVQDTGRVGDVYALAFAIYLGMALPLIAFVRLAERHTGRSRDLPIER